MTEKLKAYNQKRNFDKTREPEGTTGASEAGLRFVVQHHLARNQHYDLRLEWEGVLLSWAVPKGPSYHTRDKRLAVRVEEHPLEYRNFEGTIPKGEYGGGVVLLWDEGFWEPLVNVEEGLRKGELKFALKGRRLKGKWALVRWQAKSGEARDNWLLLKERDEYAQTEAGISQFTTSIRSGRTLAEIEGGEGEKMTRNPFDSADIQLAKLVNQVPEEGEWLYELKYDGYRIMAFVESNRVRLMTRNGNDYTRWFHTVADSLLDLAAGRPMVLDGEMAITDPSGKTDFQALQNYMKNPKGKNPAYIIFDLLALDGTDLREQPLLDRKERLEALMQDVPAGLYYGRYVRGKAKESFAAACEAGMEGIIGKKADSVYSGTRNGDWIKLKCDQRQELVIGGYTLSDKKTRGISSLLLGFYEGEAFVYAGRAGTGLSKADQEMLEEKFEGLKRLDPPFQVPPKSRAREKITWLQPELVAEIKFAEWTEKHLLRQASFKGLRTDKSPKDIVRERVEEAESPLSGEKGEKPVKAAATGLMIEGIKITSPDKVLFEHPEITKADVARYYERAAERMLPHVSHRILSVVRCPKGISQSCFFKKHPGTGGNQGISTISIPAGSKEAEAYFYLENISGIISEVQMGTLEFHTWGSRVNELEKPDMMVFDLDPDEGLALSSVRQGVRDIRNILNELSLNAYLKTSGGKGYHVVVPLKPVVTWEVLHDFAKRVAEVMEQKWPDRYTSNVRKAKRKDKIFIDWIRNGRGATSIAPYSLRARNGARVSMPIGWDELDRIEPDGIDLAEALLRMKGQNPWSDFFKNEQMLRQ